MTRERRDFEPGCTVSLPTELQTITAAAFTGRGDGRCRCIEGEQGGGSSGRERAEDKLWENDVLSHLLRKEQICRVMELAAGYDRAWVLIFQRKIFLEHSFREIAEDLGIPESTVKTRYYQMIRGIREEMERDEKRTGK